jgi:hypothetical protein
MATIKLNAERGEGHDGTMTLKPDRPLLLDNCPYCKEGIADQADEAMVREYFENTVPVGGDVKYGSEIDTNIDAQFASDNTGSDQSWLQVQEWLEICSTNHKECRGRREAVQKMKYPTRLLDLGLIGREEDDFRLVLSIEETLVGEYKTLSHRWGNSSTIILTSNNLRSFKSKMLGILEYLV